MHAAHPFGGLTMRRLTLSVAVSLLILCGLLPGVFAQLTPDKQTQAQALIRQFSAREFAVRQEAVKKLIEMGPDVLPLVRKTLGETDDAEVKLRCEMVIKGLTKPPEPEREPDVILPPGGFDEHEAKFTPRRIMSLGPAPPRLGSRSKYAQNGEGVVYILKRDDKELVVYNGKEGPPYDRIKQHAISPDGRRWTYIAESGGKAFAVCDGKESPEYDSARDLVMSSDGEHVAYVASQANRYFILRDGKELPLPDANVARLQFSPDGERLAYILGRPGKQFVVCDGQAGKPHERIWSPLFSPDSKRLAYHAARKLPFAPGERRPRSEWAGLDWSVVVDGKEWKGRHLRGRIWFSPDSRHALCQIWQAGKTFVVCDQAEGVKHDAIWALTGCGSLRYVALDGQELRLIEADWPRNRGDGGRLVERPLSRLGELRAGAKVPPTTHGIAGYFGLKNAVVFRHGGEDYTGSLFVMLDGKHVWYTAEQGGETFVFWNDRRWPTGGRPWGITFSPDGKHIAYSVRRGNRRYIVCDGRKGREYASMRTPYFSPDGRHLCYMARYDPMLYFVVVDGFEGPRYPRFQIPWRVIRRTGKLGYIAGDEFETWLYEVDWPADRDWTHGLEPIEP